MERLILRPRYFSADEDRVHIRLLRELGDHRLAVEAAKLLREQAEEIVRLKAEIEQLKQGLYGALAECRIPVEGG